MYSLKKTRPVCPYKVVCYKWSSFQQSVLLRGYATSVIIIYPCLYLRNYRYISKAFQESSLFANQTFVFITLLIGTRLLLLSNNKHSCSVLFHSCAYTWVLYMVITRSKYSSNGEEVYGKLLP